MLLLHASEKKYNTMSAPADIINWSDAMQQCGDDEEFLRELLADLRSEADAQVTSIGATIQVRSNT